MMRLFIAINFDDEIKDYICKVIQSVKNHAIKGNFTRRENYHLTLVFIGETKNIDNAKHAIDIIDAKPFELCIAGLGKFKRAGGDIYWLDVQKNRSLEQIYKKLFNELLKEGFKLDNREHKPHLTLGRELILDSDFDINKYKDLSVKTRVERISLMKSERIAGKLIYTEVYAKNL